MKLSFGFLAILLTFLAIIAGSSLLVLRTLGAFGLVGSPAAARTLVWFFSATPIVLILCMTLYNKINSPALSFFYHIGIIWLPILLYLFLGSILLWITYFISKSFGVHLPMTLLASIVVFVSLAATAYGIWNATRIRIVTQTVESAALSADWRDKNIVLVSDTHLGIVRNKHFMKKVVKKINSVNPDIVLFAGDIIDGPKFNYAKGLEQLSELRATFGVFYTPGNHEAYNSEPEKFYPIIEKYTIMLRDRKVDINNTQIIGLDFKNETADTTATRLSTAGYNANKPSIVIMHDPKNIKALQNAGVSLAVSGHTHCGQFFPINLIVKSIYKKYTYGVNQVGNTASVTTCGVGTAMSPLRLGTNPEIVIIKVK